MGRLTPGKGGSPVNRRVGLRKRWLRNTMWIVLIVGLACSLAVTAVFGMYYYDKLESELRSHVESVTDSFENGVWQNFDEYYQSCVNRTQTFAENGVLTLQFVDSRGNLIASSGDEKEAQAMTSPEIQDAVRSRGICAYVGRDSGLGEHVLAVSGPLIYSDGEVVGVLRCVASTRQTNLRILLVAISALLALVVIVVAIVVCSSYYTRSILAPIGEITEKAKKIAGGTYGIQISKKYDDEIGELVDTINEMSVQINQNAKIQTDFISSLSHELRTPLTAITGWSETLLSSDALDQETRRGTRIIHREAKRLTEMVEELLDFTRIQDGRMTLNIEPTDIRAEFEDTVYMYSGRLSQDGIELKFLDNDDEIPVIPCDPKRLRQVFLNILDNAAKHGGEGKRIEASMHFENGNVVARIRDYGPGIPEDEIPLVKKKFYKGSSKARGSGIGLAVCDEIVEMHSGSLILENAPGGGTLVTVRLPAAQ